MITVTFRYDETGTCTGFSALGHAGYAAEGEDDILCAAITALTTGTIGSLQDLVKAPLEYLAEEGEIRCELAANRMNPKQLEESQLLFRSLELSCKQVSLTYGDRYVKVIRSDS